MLAAVPPSLLACMALALTGAAIQVAVGAGLSVVCGPFVLLWIGPKAGLPILWSLNLIVSIVATAVDAPAVDWADAIPAALVTLAGCFLASLVPGLSDTMLKAVTAAVLLVVALPRPPAADRAPGAAVGLAGIAAASLVTGAVTVWTATPGPIIPMALARVGRSGAVVRRTMQPISVVGYGAALVWVGAPSLRTMGERPFQLLVVATLLGIAAGFWLRGLISASRVILLVRIVAATAAVLLIASILR